jgi:ferredoxin-NADP reductase/phytoene dehydrogenase-like protein
MAAATQGFDAIVIGSGIGGLAAARLLSEFGGKRVLVLEQHTRPGGMTHEFERPGADGASPARFSSGLHYIGTGDEPARWRGLFDLVTGGALQWQRMPGVFERIRMPGLAFDMPSGQAALHAALLARFPSQDRALAHYFGAIRRAARALLLLAIARSLPRPIAAVAEVAIRATAPGAFRTTAQEMARLFPHAPELRTLLTATWGDFGVPSRTAFAHHATVALHYLDGAMHPIGGSARIAEGAVAALRAAGSEVRTGVMVEEVLVEGGRATGVRLRDRATGAAEMIRASWVVSDAGLRNTLGALLPPEHSARFTAALAALGDSPSAVVLFLTLRASPATIGATGANIWALPGADHDASLAAPPGEGIAYLSFSSLKDPAAATHAMEVVSIVSERDATFARWQDAARPGDDPDYRALKARIAARLLDQAEAALPGLKGLVVAQELATPLTFRRYQRSPGGGFYGIACEPARLRSALAGARTPIPGLVLAGQDAFMPGVVAALIGGACAAATVLGTLGGARMWRRALGWTAPPRAAPWQGHLRIAAAKQEAPGVLRLSLEPPEGGELPFAFQAGQFLMLHAPLPGGGAARAYSIGSAPGERGALEIAVKREPGGAVSGWLHDHARAGLHLRIEAPFGRFLLPDDPDRPLLLVGGGVGVTPLIGQLRHLAATGRRAPVGFLGAFRSPAAFLFRAELEGLAAAHPWLRLRLLAEEPGPGWAGGTGRPDAAALAALLEGQDPARAVAHLCGPPAMMAAVAAALRGLGLSEAAICREAFAASLATPPAAADAPWVEVAFRASGRRARVRAGTTLLDAAEAGGVALRTACRSGECGACRLRVLAGQAAMAPTIGLTMAERAAGFVLACQARAETDLEVLA